MTPRIRKVSDAQVLEAAARTISRVGPAGLTLALVAEEAGLAAPTLIQRFGSRRGLLLALAGSGAAAVGGLFADARASGDGPLPTLELALRRMTRHVGTREALSNHLAFLQLDLADPEFRVHAEQHGLRFRAEVEALLAEAAAAGEIAEDMDRAALARAIQVAYNGALVTWAIHGEGAVDDAVVLAVRAVLGATPTRSDAPASRERPARGGRGRR